MNSTRLYKMLLCCFLAVCITTFTNCSSTVKKKETGSMQVTDMIGRSVTIPAKIDSVFASGHSKTVVATFVAEKIPGGVTYSSESNTLVAKEWWGTGKMKRGHGGTKPGKGTKGKMPPRVPQSDSLRIARTAEQLEKSHATIAVFETDHFTGDFADALQKKTGIPVVIIDLSVYRMKELFTLLGKVFSEEEQTEKLIGFVTKYIDPIGERAKSIPENERVHFYYAEGRDGLRTEPEGSFHTMAMEFSGGINVVKADSGKPVERSINLTAEKLDSLAPGMIFVSTPGSEKLPVYSAFCTNDEWKSLPAVKDEKVYQIQRLPFSWIDRPPGANRMIGVIWSANILYPNVFSFDMIQVTKEFFNVFYHTDISDEQAKSLLVTQPEPVLPTEE